ncbi:MAG: hybrid sensor histidine kinase/response regulator [Oscillatoria sp. SIO1A7]|nr:hybrid sensor histidine kinase/response regulator [Oscillatoria sp. SIO1A7]
MTAKILVIEDEQSILENIVELLEAEELEGIAAGDGINGLQLAREKKPDLIICDIMMPGMNGYEVLSSLQEDPDTATIPFIFLTAKSEKPDARKGMTLGADDYITKPCKPDELVQAIATRLKKQDILKCKSQEKLHALRHSIALSMPHELKTPLNAILGFAELLVESSDSLGSSEIKEMGQIILDSGERLHHMIQNFLLYAELEMLASEPDQLATQDDCEVTYATSLIRDRAIKLATLARREEDLNLELLEVPLKISAKRLNKLAEELIDNAFKFSEPGTPVRVTSKLEKKQFVLTVSDRGRGMSPAQIAEVGAYMQFGRKIYEQQGAGLGLAIVKRLAELHGGTFAIESDRAASYTTVRVTLPTYKF